MREPATEGRYCARCNTETFHTLHDGVWQCEFGCALSAVSAESPPAPKDLPRIPRLPRSRKWDPPALDAAALHGPAGDWAKAVQPYTEASVAGVLVSTLVAFGNAAGRNPHALVTATGHHTNENALIVGPTASGRKGEAMKLGLLPVRLADEDWAARVSRGFGSGEAIVVEVRDPLYGHDSDGNEITLEEGTGDKRLLLHEDEFAAVLAVAGRDGSTLSPLMRSAWDGAKLENRTKRQKIVATNAHVSVLAAITPDELVRKVTGTEIANGFLNRFLLVAARRTKHLPEPEQIPTRITTEQVATFSRALTFARSCERLRRDPDATRLWANVYERELSIDRFGLAGVACSRAEAHTLRLSLLYALLDQSTVVSRVHLEAALAVWRYCEQSARLIFGDRLGDPVADAIDDALRDEPDGLTRNDIRNLFHRHRNSAEIENALATLLELGRVQVTQEETGGRPALRYRTTASVEAQA